MDGEALLRKLQIKPGARVVLIGAPAEVETAIEAAVTLTEPGQASDAALAFCAGPADVAAFAPQALTGLAPDGVLWFAYRKGAVAKQTGLSRDVGWDALNGLGYRPVRSIAFDEAWTGLRLREAWRVKSGDQ
ncbi:MAG TPA: hypothetical protein VGM25_06935 [Caulobacteraceae bacterium]|jgi:hypothetical protein